MSRPRRTRFASRAQAVASLRAQLERGSWPRAQMMLLVLLTGGAGFVASFVMLALGVGAMGIRYLLACLAAYACFLAMLGAWIRWQRGERDFDPGIDLPDGAGHAPGGTGGWGAGGGRSGGAGASARFDAPSPAVSPGDAGGLDLDLDAGDAAIPLLLVLLVLGVLLSSLFVVWTAPALFAELLLDGVLAAGLYRRLHGIDTRHWLQTAVRKTAWPFLLTTAALAAGGFWLQSLAPRAASIGDVLAQLAR